MGNIGSPAIVNHRASMTRSSTTTASPPILAPAGDLSSGQPAVPLQHPTGPMQATSQTPNANPQITSLTSKEWVVPPRPKPGRKPATDAPPTKRKAQNRAAQRAFRERRAARVGELEEEIKKIEVEDEEQKNELRARIEKLQKEAGEYRTSLSFWMQRCRGLEAELAVENAAREEALRSAKEPSAVAASRPAEDQSEDEALQEGAEAMGCGKCSSITNCQCIQEVINMQGLESDSEFTDLSSNKRPSSPAYNHLISKRIKPEPPDTLEMDFTTTFSYQPTNNIREGHISPCSSSALADPCGFCTDGTPCICAEMQAAEAGDSNSGNHTYVNRNHDQTQTCQRLNMEPDQQRSSSSLPRISQLSQFTPPPSDTDVSLPTSLHHDHPSSLSNPCINGPGTCLQCRSDPNSTLFCKSLAKSQQKQRATTSIAAHRQQSGCCGASAGTGSSCCQSAPPAPPLAVKGSTRPVTRTRSSDQNATPGDRNPGCRGEEGEKIPQPIITLTCADAYATLSRHPGYQQATGDMARWLPRLHPTTPHLISPDMDDRNGDTTLEQGGGRCITAADASHDVQGRPAMEIDAANVMSVLRDFDRRFSS